MKLAEGQAIATKKQTAYLEEAQSLVTMEIAVLSGLFDEILNDDSVSSSIKARVAEYTKREAVEEISATMFNSR